MPRQHALNHLLLRKQLLLTEAELQREQLRQELRTIGEGLDALGKKARSVGSVLSLVGALAGGVAAVRGLRSKPPKSDTTKTRPSLVSTLFSGIRVATAVWRGWTSFRNSNRDHEQNHAEH